MNRALEALGIGVVLGLLAGLVIGSGFARSATSPTAQPVASDWTWQQVAPATAGLSEAPQPTPGTSADVTAPSRGGASPLPVATEAPSLPPSSPPATPGAVAPSSAPGATANRVLTTSALTGTASWFCLSKRSACTVGYPPSSLVAAAGPRLRAALGPGWRGKAVTVRASSGRQVTVKLADWCQCHAGTSRERIIDVYSSVVGALGLSLSRGIYTVTVRWS